MCFTGSAPNRPSGYPPIPGVRPPTPGTTPGVTIGAPPAGGVAVPRTSPVLGTDEAAREAARQRRRLASLGLDNSFSTVGRGRDYRSGTTLNVGTVGVTLGS